MGRLRTADREVMRTFWRAHMEGWKRSDLNQREYCEVHGLSLKNFGNWRAQLTYEDTTLDRKVRWRPGASEQAGPPGNQPATDPPPAPVSAPLIIERPSSCIEIELSGGRWLRFDRDADPETVRRMISAIEGEVR